MRVSKRRELRVVAPSAPGRPAHLSAASGLVRLGSTLYVVADDELHLGAFPMHSDEPGQLIRLLPGDLPDTLEERKKAKPDFEALLHLPIVRGFSQGALLALGSGSKKRRRSGVLVPIELEALSPSSACVIDCTELFDALAKHVDDLNIEGALVNGDRLQLLHRGNKSHAANTIFTLHLRTALKAIEDERTLGRPEILAVRQYQLGEVDKIPLCFTDGLALGDGRIVFSAVAEDTTDSYRDGPCAAAAIGTIAPDGAIQSIEHIDPPYKIEGVHAELENGLISVWLVTDADDVRTPATLLTGTLALG